MKKIALSPSLFDELVAKTRLKERGVALARRALVDDEGYSDIARAEGVSRADVYQAANTVLRHYPRAGDETHAYTGPAEMFAEINAVVRKFGGQKIR